MAFDMRFENTTEKIDSHEEVLFSYISKDKDFPCLNKLWEDFYNDPIIGHSQSNCIVHELIALRSRTKDDKTTQYVIERLLPFFSKAFVLKQEIRCISD